MASREESLVERADISLGLLAGVLSFCVYAWTVAPSVTLLDSGEFLVAAQHFGVPHPTGYPLWTMLAWLFSLLPLGNAAWEINLLSGVFGALAVGLSAGMMRSFLRWIFPEVHRGVPGLVSLAALSSALLFAFSFSMWSQAVITEVYTLHALLVGGFLAALYAWIRRPHCDRLLATVFFLLTLAFSNHHLMICLAPLPILAVLLIRREIFWNVFLAALVTACGFYALLGWISGDPLVAKASVRFGFFTGLIFLAAIVLRRLRGARYLLIVPLAVVAGLLPYAYLPVASSTNPPMNWGYTRELAGLFHTFNRSQYSGPLTEQSLRVIGRMMGVPSHSDFAPAPVKDPLAPAQKSRASLAVAWAWFFFAQLACDFTALGLAAYAASLGMLFFALGTARRAWMALLHIGFLLAAFLQPLLERAVPDVSGWWVQMPYHTYTNLFFAMLCSSGFVGLLALGVRRWPRLRTLRFVLLVLPLVPLLANYSECSQRGRWFGWMYGHDMLKDLPRGSVVVGGSDPGRFIPTYMIFGESAQFGTRKRDPDFDRRDLFVLTQNALGEPRYMKYLRDQYTEARPAVREGFEKKLGRDEIYPTDRLILPTREEIAAAIQAAAQPDPQTGHPLEGNPSILPYSAVLRWIWEKNKDWHDFFIEESFPITWTYDYAIPWGLTYRMSPHRLDAIPAEAVARDSEFWSEYKSRLLGDPLFLDDLDARRSFARLRFTIGNIYRHRKMNPEAERAYLDALELYPADGAAIHALTGVQWERGEFDQTVALCEEAVRRDPNNPMLPGLLSFASVRREIQGRVASLERKLQKRPDNKNALKQLIMLHASVGDLVEANGLVRLGFQRFSTDPDFLRFAAAHDVINGQPLNSLAPALKLAEIEPENPANLYILANAWYFHTNYPEFFAAMRRAVGAGGVPMRGMFSREPMFAPIREHPEFREILQSRPADSL